MSLHSYDHPRKLSLRHINSPCQGCSYRKVGCHAECDRYKAYSEELDRTRKAGIETMVFEERWKK